jgi:hypothetical protein
LTHEGNIWIKTGAASDALSPNNNLSAMALVTEYVPAPIFCCRSFEKFHGTRKNADICGGGISSRGVSKNDRQLEGRICHSMGQGEGKERTQGPSKVSMPLIHNDWDGFESKEGIVLSAWKTREAKKKKDEE